MPSFTDEEKAEFKATLQKELEISGSEEKYFILEKMLRNLGKTQSLESRSSDFVPQFDRQNDPFGTYFMLNQKSKLRSEEIEVAFRNDNLIDKLADMIVEKVEDSTYPEWREAIPQALLESCFYQNYCQAARELFNVKQHDMGNQLVFRGIPESAIPSEKIHEFFLKPHRGTQIGGISKGLMEYAISTPGRFSLEVGHSTGRANHATSTTVIPSIACDYATKGFFEKPGLKKDVDNGWVIIAKAKQGVNPQLTQNRWYAEITMDEIPPEDILAVCKVVKKIDVPSYGLHSAPYYEIGEIHYNPHLEPALLTEELKKIQWLHNGQKVKTPTQEQLKAEIQALPVSKRLLAGGPLVETSGDIPDQLERTNEEKLLYQLLERALNYVAMHPEQTLAHDRHSEASNLAEAIIKELCKQDRVDLKISRIGKLCETIIAKNNKGNLSKCAAEFLQKSEKVSVSANKVERIQSNDELRHYINGFDELKNQLVHTSQSSPNFISKFINWLKSLCESKPEKTNTMKERLADLKKQQPMPSNAPESLQDKSMKPG